MDAGLPVLAIVDGSTDVGETVRLGGFGWECRSDNISGVVEKVEYIRDCVELEEMGKTGRRYLEEHYNSKIAFDTIMSHFPGSESN